MFGDLKTYINQRITLTKYEIIDSTSNLFSIGIFILVVSFSLLFLVLLGSITAGFLLGNYFNNVGYGFLAVTGIYFLFLLFCLLFRKKIQEIFADIAVKSAMNALYNDDDNDDEEE